MIKVAHLTSVHPTQDVRIFFKQCLSLKQAGYQVSLVAQSDRDEMVNGIEIYSVGRANSRWKRMTIILWRIYKKARELNADIYHFHDPELIIIGLLLRLQGKKVIYDVHEDVPRDILLKDWIPVVVRNPIAKFVALVEYFAAKILSGIITVTPRIKHRFKHAHVIEEVRNYPLREEFNHPPFIAGDKTLCYSGLITPKRGLLEMIHVAEATSTPLVLAGALGSDSLYQQIRAAKNVSFVGYLDRMSLKKLYQQSFAGMALLHSGPTFNEALPIKLFEYMSAGIPVIASDFKLWRGIIEKYDCGFCIDPTDIELVAEKIKFLKTHPTLALEMGQRGRRAIEDYFNWQNEATKLISFYQKILS